MALIYERRNHKEDYFVYDYRKYIDCSFGLAGSDNKLCSSTRITCPHLNDVSADWQAFNKWAFSSVLKVNSASVLIGKI